MLKTEEKPTYPFIIAGCLALLSSAYLDNIRGPLIPIIATSLSLSHGKASLFLTAGSLAAVLGTFCLLPLLNRYSEKNVAIAAFSLALVCATFGHFVDGYFSLLLFGFLLGGTMASLGTMSNVLTIRGCNSDGRWLSLLHVMYGLGSLASPVIVGLLVSHQVAWPYWVSWFAIVLAFFLAFIVCFLPSEKNTTVCHKRQSTKISGIQWLIVLIYCVYVCGEVLTSMWLVSFLVEVKGHSIAGGSVYLMGFFAILALTRFAAFLFGKSPLEYLFLWGSLLLPVAFFICGYLVSDYAFCLTGAVGPFFPLFLARVNKRFAEQSRNLTIWLVVFIQLTLGLGHLSFGGLADLIGMRNAFLLPPFFLLVTAGLLSIYNHFED